LGAVAKNRKAAIYLKKQHRASRDSNPFSLVLTGIIENIA
jgi:hypothetical protein